MRVRAEGVRYAYDGDIVLHDVSFVLPEGKITVVIGPSGSGKSTLLKLLAGLAAPHAGAVLFDDRDMAGVPTEKRDIGVVFQSYALFPHLTVRDNIAFGLRTGRRRRAADEVKRRAADAAALLDITRLLDRKPTELSGGEQQRVAVARAIAPEPAFLLFDEPLSALDARLRRSLRAELAQLLRRLGTTVFYVTHDQEEALWMADHLIVLNRGVIEQEGAPLDVYRRPASAFVASFLGEANLVEADITAAGASTALGPIPVTSDGAGPGVKGRLLLRPEDFAPHPDGVEATVLESRGLGPHDRVVVQLDSGDRLLIHLPPETAPGVGERIRIAPRPGRSHFLMES